MKMMKNLKTYVTLMMLYMIYSFQINLIPAGSLPLSYVFRWHNIVILRIIS